jgi:uncharacterized protein YcfJ
MSCGKVVTLLLGAASLAAGSAMAADLSDIVVTPVAGQSSEQARRDRYECHNWALQQNVRVPPPAPPASQVTADRRAERMGKVLTGAAIGATVGSIIGGFHGYGDVGEGALAGGVLGAIGGTVAGARSERKLAEQEDELFTEYFRALDACMTARGYTLSVTGQDA